MIRLIVLLCCLLLSQTAIALSYTVEVSEEELQEKLATMMPLEKKKYFVTVTFSQPKIDLAENANRIGIYSQLDITAPGGIKSSGSAKISGSLSYVPAKSEFYFKDITIDDMQVAKVPETYLPAVKEVAELIAVKMLSSTPIYKLKGGDLKGELVKSMLKSVVVKNRQLLMELELF